MVNKDNILAAISIYGDMASKFLQISLSDLQKFHNAIHNSIQIADSEELAISAHSLKSILAQIGAHDASAICFELEKIAKENSLPLASEYLAKLDLEINKLKSIISEII